MLRIVLGYKTPSLTEDPEVLYCGCDGNKAEAAIAANPNIRIEVANSPTLVRRRGYTVPVETKSEKKGK